MRLLVNKRMVVLVFTLALAVFTWWFQQQQEQVREEKGTLDDRLVDYAMRDFEVTAMDEQGRPRNYLKAESMVHYSDDDRAELQAPQLRVYRENGEPWILASDSAVVYQGGAVVHMQGAVKLQQLGDAGEPLLTMDTRELWVYADREYAESSEAVFVEDSMGTTQAHGVTIDMDSGRLKLLADVRGKYVLEH